MPFIRTRATHFQADKTDEDKRGRVQRFLVTHGLPTISDWTPTETVEAYINDGRWIAECPHHCGGAELVDPDWPFFVCSAGCGGGPYEVVFPKQRAKVEAAYIKAYWKGPE